MVLSDQKVIVIGGSAGLGLATAQMAAEKGASVIIVGRSEDKLQKALSQVKAKGKQLDLSKGDQIEKFFKEIGEFDHLVITGGVTPPGSCLGLDLIKAREGFESKFWGQYCSVKFGAPLMKKTGSITLFSGVFGMRPPMDMAVLASVNGALEGLTRALAVELAPIRVNIISPGFIKTERIANMPDKAKEGIDKMISNLPLKKAGTPENIAEAVQYLMTNDYVTGTTLCVDGGYSFH